MLRSVPSLQLPATLSTTDSLMPLTHIFYYFLYQVNLKALGLLNTPKALGFQKPIQAKDLPSVDRKGKGFLVKIHFSETLSQKYSTLHPSKSFVNNSEGQPGSGVQV